MLDTKWAHLSRREFVSMAAIGTGIVASAPYVATAKKTDTELIVGKGDYQYEVTHDWLQLPNRFHWQTTHNVAVDSEGLVYVIHEGDYDLKDHPSIFVFDPDGKFVRAFGKQFQGGGHGIEIRREKGQDFLYIAAYLKQRSLAKLDTKGEIIWRKYAPMEAGIYTQGEDILPRTDNPIQRDSFLPTNYAFHPDGGFYVADGYGAYVVHRYDENANWLRSFGGLGTDDGQFNTPHGLCIDNRQAGSPALVVCDRVNARLQWFTLDGEHLHTRGGFLLPANNDVYGELMLVPDLLGRVTLLNGQNRVIDHLGDDSVRITGDKEFKIRADPAQWLPGKFVHPHDACFDHNGNILVAEWVSTGRVSKLRRI